MGLDLVEVDAVAEALASSRANRYLELVYTDGERRDCTTDAGIDPVRLAARFAAKEAARKALGDAAVPLPWRSVEVLRGPGGEPSLRLSDEAAAVARTRAIREFAVSLTHEPGYAAAVVVATG